MSHRILSASYSMVGLAVGLSLAVTDWRFRFIYAPFYLTTIFVIVSIAESYSRYRRFKMRGQGDRFSWRGAALSKLALMTLIIAAMGLDTMGVVYSKAAPELFPAWARLDIPIVTLVWTGWLIIAEGNNIRKNVKHSEGPEYSPPLVGPVLDMVERVKREDTRRAGGELPNRRWTDKSPEALVEKVLIEGVEEDVQ